MKANLDWIGFVMQYLQEGSQCSLGLENEVVGRITAIHTEERGEDERGYV